MNNGLALSSLFAPISKPLYKTKFFQKTCSVLANFSLFLNLFLPYLAIQPAFAQGPDPAPIVENTPVPTPEIAPEITPEITPEVTPEVTPEIAPEPTTEPTNTEPVEVPTIEPTPTEIVNIDIGTQTPAIETITTPTEIPVVEKVCLTGGEIIEDTTNEDWIVDDVTGISETKENVKLGVRYVYPQESKVTIIFKCLPADESLHTPLKIQKVKTSDLNLPDSMSNVSEYAYDITTDMKNGTFEYDVTFPKSVDSTVEISYIEKSLDDAITNEIKVDEIKSIDESKTEQSGEKVKAISLDHFTIYYTSSRGDEVYVCKYVGRPGVDERLMPGNNPIKVSVNAIQNPVVIGAYFNDAHGRSFVIGFVPMNPEPTVADCPSVSSGTLIIDKVTNPSGDQTSFSFTVVGSETNINQSFDLSDLSIPWSMALPIGAYSVSEIVPAGWDLTSAVCSDNSPVDAISLQAGETVTCTFTNTKLSSIQGRKYNDVNANGNFDTIEKNAPGDPNRLDGWTINLFDTNWKLVDSMNTGDDNTPAGNVDKGQYRFVNLLPGTYHVCEVQQQGWTQTEPALGSQFKDQGPYCHTLELAPGQAINTVQFGNVQLSDIHGYKWHDLDNNGQKNAEEPLLSGWTINLYRSIGDGEFDLSPYKSMVTDSSEDHLGWYWFEDLLPGIYKICEVSKVGWDQTYPLNENGNCHEVNLPQDKSPEWTVNMILGPEYNFGNLEMGSVNVTKFNDLNGNGQFDEGENVLSGWDINLSKNSKTTGENGQVLFDQLIPGSYSLSEDIKEDEGWTQTGITCDVITPTPTPTVTPNLTPPVSGFNLVKPVNAVVSPNGHNNYQINLSAGQNLQCYIGNQRLEPRLTIAKSNDVSGDKTPGSSVGFKIMVNVFDNDVDDLIVTDLPSNGFVYRPGSFGVTQNGNPILIDEPIYQSPGVWKIGNVKAGDKLELTYLADISNDQQPGTYKDLAYAYGVAAYDNEADVIATSEVVGHVNENMVGTQVPIVASTQHSISAGVEKHEEGQVLGASTELPSTGANTIWLIISALMTLIGLAFIKKSSPKFVTIILLALFCLFAPATHALEPLSILLQQPKSPTNIKDLKLTFVALDMNNNPITVKCFKKGPSDSAYSQFGANISLAAPGNTSHCETNSSILNAEGTYNFYVTANNILSSDIVSVDYKTSGPGTPTNYRKEWLNKCDYKIHFKTADDGGKTVKVELYRADITNFILDAGSRVASINIGSNQESTITNSVPDCSKSYYYVLRAFDDAGNGSGTIGDSVTITTTSTTTDTTTTTDAIPVINVTLSPEDESLLIATPSPEEFATDNEEGTVLGTTINTIKSFVQKSWLPLLLGFIGLFAIIRYVLKKKKRSSYR